jgi:drug/metabolite transporter (DMT)-like permease
MMEKKGLYLVFLTALISGVSIFLNAFGVKGINPFVFTGLKNVIVCVFLFSIILLVKEFKSLKVLNKNDWLKLSLVGLIGGSVPFLLFFKGLQLTTAASGGFVHKTMIVWVVLLSLFFLKEKLNYKIVIGAVFLLVGNFFLLNISGFAIDEGIILIFLATLLWSSEIILSKYLLKRLSGNLVAFGRMFFGSLFIMAFLLVTNNFTLSLGIAQWSWILITSVFLLGYVFTFYNGLKYVTASTAVSILSLGAVITTVLQLVFLDKIISLVQVFGIVFIVLGVLTFVSKKFISFHKHRIGVQ